MDAKISGRDIAAPLGWVHGRPGMAWHHIVPFRVLREVWNRLVDRHVDTELAEARVALRRFLTLSDRLLPNLDSMLDRMHAEGTSQKRAVHKVLAPLDLLEVQRLNTAAVWPSWNAVEGPAKRSDDPGDRHLDRFYGGVTAGEAVAMRTIEVLFSQFQAFLAAGAEPGAGSLNALALGLAAARPVLGASGPIRYRPEMWVDDGNGRWRKRRQGERIATAAT